MANAEKDAITHKDQKRFLVARRVYYEAVVVMAVHCRSISGAWDIIQQLMHGRHGNCGQ